MNHSEKLPSWFWICLALSGLIVSLQPALAQESAQEPPPATEPAKLQVTVTDENDKPIAGANVELRKWTGVWKKLNLSGTTDPSGKVEFSGVPRGDYLSTLVQHPNYANSLNDFSLDKETVRKQTIKLTAASKGALRVVTPENKPLKGAQIQRLEVVNEATGMRTTLSHEMFEMFGPGDFTSDESGRLPLPPLPAGSQLKATLFHPNWSPNVAFEFDLNNDDDAPTIAMRPGIAIRSVYHGNEESLKLIDQNPVSLRIFNREDRSSRIIHPLKGNLDGNRFTLPPGQYESMRLSADGVSITPIIPSSTLDAGLLDFSKPANAVQMVVRKNQTLTGRVVDESGKPVAGVGIDVDIENLRWDAETRTTVPDNDFAWMNGDYQTTDSDGRYTVQLPKGKAKVKAFWSGYYSTPEYLDVVVEGQNSIPDYVVKKMPTITGTVRDSQGNLIPNAIIRLLSTESVYAATDKDGTFSIEIDSFDYDYEKKSRVLKKSLLIYASDKREATLRSFSFDQSSEFTQVEIELEPTADEWLVDQITASNKQRFGFQVNEKMKQQIERMRDKYLAGHPGNTVPDLSEGTWLNTDAKSLDDFRGKYVLLDFWFIGCGPCHRDMPSVLKAYQLYRDAGFAVVSVHIPGQSPEQVKQFADANGMIYPLVVDTPDGKILSQYKDLGVEFFPNYILLDPDGRIVANDAVPNEKGTSLSLRNNKIEQIRELILNQKTNSEEK